MPYKYVLNNSSKTLHIINGCCHSRNTFNNSCMHELFVTENEAISKHQNHIKRCKLCFKSR